jgi:fructokinase
MITVVGESVVDVVDRVGDGEFTVHPGGSPANVAVALSRLGQRAALVTQIGADDHGTLMRTHLDRNGVEVILAGPADQPTNRSLVRLDAQGAAAYEVDLRWDVRQLRLPEGSVALHFGSVGVMLAPGGQQVLRLAESVWHRGDVVTSYDPNIRPSVTPNRHDAVATMERAAACAHLVRMSDEDLAFLTTWCAIGDPRA